MAVTIEWLLSQKALGTFELLAGARGVGNTITSVNIIDNPDTIRWLTEGELILSTGYLFQENVWMRNNTIQELAGRRCAGIGFVLKRYVDRLPEEMLEQADRLDFPIITVPYERSLAEVGRLIYRRIFEKDMTETQQLSSLYRTLTEAAAKGGISGLLTGIVQVVGCPVLALSADFELLEYETLSAGTKSRLADFLHMEAGKPVFSEGIAHQIREKYARQRFVMTEQLLHRQEESLKLLCFAIAQGEDLLGYLCFPQDGSAFGTFEYNFVRTVEPIVAIELMRHIIHAKSKINIKNDFIRSILDQDFSTIEELQLQCRMHSFDYTSKRVCAAIRLQDYDGSSLLQRKKLEDSAYLEMDALTSRRAGVYKLSFNNNLILFYMYPQDMDIQEMVQEGEQSAREIVARLREVGIRSCAGISKPYAGAQTIRRCLLQAFGALELGEKVRPEVSVHSYYEDEAYHILSESLTRQRAQELYDQSLGRLRRFDEENHTDLLLTAQKMLEHNLSTTETAKALFIHRNTMFYRVEKIKEVLGENPKELRTGLRLLMGAYLEKLLRINSFQNEE